MIWQNSRLLVRTFAQGGPTLIHRYFHASPSVLENLQWFFPIPKKYTEETLRTKLSEFGPIAKLNLPKFSHGGHKMIASVVFESDESADKFKSAIINRTLAFDDRALELHLSRDLSSFPHASLVNPARYVTVFGVPPDIEGIEELKNCLSQFGPVKNIRMKRKPVGSMGYASVEFKDIEGAQKAFAASAAEELHFLGDYKLSVIYIPTMENKLYKSPADPPLIFQRRHLHFRDIPAEQVKEWLKPFADKIVDFDVQKRSVIFPTEDDGYMALQFLHSHPDSPELNKFTTRTVKAPKDKKSR